MDETPKQVILLGSPETGDTTQKKPEYVGALEPELARESDAAKAHIDDTLQVFVRVLNRLRRTLEDYSVKVENDDLQAAGLNSEMRQIGPLLSATIQQEKKVNDTIQQRVGEAGKYAFDLESARSEIRGRLARLRKQHGAERVSDGTE
ncbi:hypothetical protein [uncultured Litoreibacter sp.]|uniref:hypothetical protein n=1 Tax=uncultured Litoreibacter sp. TaxID=1392394 RepID=UPI00260B7921|nr:hypothetical protein [uncultured Litoreibacter sp.]